MQDVFKWLWVVAASLAVAATTNVDFDAIDAARARQHIIQTGTATPTAPLEYELCPGDDVALPMHVYLPPAPAQADIVFAFDTTGSMSGVTGTMRGAAAQVITNLQTLIEDVRFSVVDFRDYPPEVPSVSEVWPYLLREPLTRDVAAIQASIDALDTAGGHDDQESYTRVLYEAYADQNQQWRPDARRLVIMFGDSVPRDDDLNAALPPPQPFRPDETWQTGYPVDPGRDGVNGTSDDLDLESVLHELGSEHNTTVLFVVADANYLGLSIEALTTYWRVWTGMTGPGGDARALEDLADLPTTIEELVAAAGQHIDYLGVRVAPTWFEEWVTVTPPSYEDFDIPDEGLNRDFEVQITVPAQIPAGRYTLVLIAEADGFAQSRQQVIVNVPETCFATPTPTATLTPTATPVPTPTPRPIWRTYVSLVANNRANWRP